MQPDNTNQFAFYDPASQGQFEGAERQPMEASFDQAEFLAQMPETDQAPDAYLHPESEALADQEARAHAKYIDAITQNVQQLRSDAQQHPEWMNREGNDAA